MKRTILITAFAVLLVGAVNIHQVNAQFFFMEENPLIGQPAADFTLMTLSGTEQNMTKFRNGENAVIFFWATWCPHCREELKKLNERQGELEKKKIKLILVDLGEGPQQVQAYMTRNKINMEVFLDMESSLQDDYNIIGVPSFFFVNKKGEIVGAEYAVPEKLDEIFGS